jgi:hypothetical protein
MAPDWNQLRGDLFRIPGTVTMLCSFDSDLRAEMARQDRAEARGRERDRLVEIEAARLLDGDFDPLAPANFYEAVAETVDTMSVGRMLNALREGRHEHAGQILEALTVSYWQRQAQRRAETIANRLMAGDA